MQPILNLNMPSEITTDVDFFYNFLALPPARQDLRGGTRELFHASNYSCLSYYSYILHDFPLFSIKKTSNNFRKTHFLLNVFLQ